jgi:O-antigen ligase
VSASTLLLPAGPHQQPPPSGALRPARRLPERSAALRPVPLLPLAAGVVALRRLRRSPAWCAALVVALLLVPVAGHEDGSVDVRPPDLALALLIGLAALRLLLDGEGLDRLRSAVVLPVAAVVLAGGAATLLAPDPAAGVSGLARYLEVFALGPLAVLLVLRRSRDAWLLLGALVALGLGQAAVGSWQYLTASGAGFAGESRRAVGTFGAYDVMAMATTVRYALVVLVAVAVSTTGRAQRWAVAGAVLLVPALLFSLSRGALLSAAAAAGLVLVASGWRRAVRVAAVAAAAGAVALVLAGPAASTVTDRVLSLGSTASAPDQSVRDRYALWQAARSMLAERPVTGVGPRGYAAALDEASPLGLSTGSDVEDGRGYRRVALLSPHSTYWLLLAEQGVLGGLAYGALFATVLVGGLLRLRRTPATDVRHRVVGCAAVGGVVAYLVDAVYADPGGSTTVLVALVLGLGLWWASGARLVDGRASP